MKQRIKKFAQEARRKLIDLVGAKLELVLITDSSELREKAEQLRKFLLRSTPHRKNSLLIRQHTPGLIEEIPCGPWMPINVARQSELYPGDGGYSLPELLDEASKEAFQMIYQLNNNISMISWRKR